MFESHEIKILRNPPAHNKEKKSVTHTNENLNNKSYDKY